MGTFSSSTLHSTLMYLKTNKKEHLSTYLCHLWFKLLGTWNQVMANRILTSPGQGAQWLKCCPLHPKVMGLLPGQAYIQVVGFFHSWGVYERQPTHCFSLSPLPLLWRDFQSTERSVRHQTKLQLSIQCVRKRILLGQTMWNTAS